MDLPSADHEPRYRGRPLLILLESFVLAAINELPPDRDDTLLKVVQRVYGGGPDWRLTLRSQLQLPTTFDEMIRDMWIKNQGAALAHGTTLQPVQFAKMFADQNFVPWIDRLP